MLAACAPFGFAMADEIDARKHGKPIRDFAVRGAEDNNVLLRPALIWICNPSLFDG
jgi:hypothetical protein